MESISTTETKEQEIKVEKRKTTPKPKPKSKKKGQLIYIGPNIENGRLSRYTVFKDGLPKHIEILVEQRPEIEQMIIPVSDFANVNTRISQSGTLENQLFKQLKERKGK